MINLLSFVVLIIFMTLIVCDCFCFWAASKIDKSLITWTTVLLPLSGFWILAKVVRSMEAG